MRRDGGGRLPKVSVKKDKYGQEKRRGCHSVITRGRRKRDFRIESERLAEQENGNLTGTDDSRRILGGGRRVGWGFDEEGSA